MVKYKLTVDEPWDFNHNGSNVLHGIVVKQLSPTFLLFKSDSFLDFNGQKSCIIILKPRYEKEYFDLINANPDKYIDKKLKIATQPVLHGQIRYYFINENGIKEDMQKHLSSELPNILIFDENSGSKKRKDNKIDIFLNNSIRIFGNVYMKKD